MKDPCPRCGRDRAVPLRKKLASWPLLAGGLVFALPTVGISLIATVYGVFLRVPACDCSPRNLEGRPQPR